MTGQLRKVALAEEVTSDDAVVVSSFEATTVRPMKCIFSVDVEDWFHILDLPSAPGLAAWDSLPSRVEGSFVKLLDLLSEFDAKATCFFLGWVAQKFPGLVKEAHRRGHEIACHGFAHRLVYKTSRQEFRQDIKKAKQIVEGIIGREALGNRSAGFSVTENTPWFFDEVMAAGYRYDSSVFPALRGHGGLRGSPLAPYKVQRDGGSLIEFPISVIRTLGRGMCFFGGGYLRLFPYFVVRHMARKVLEEARPAVFYVHPREIDPDHPRLSMDFRRRFKSYVGLYSTENKIRRLLADFEFRRFRDVMEDDLSGLATVTGQNAAGKIAPPGLRVEIERA